MNRDHPLKIVGISTLALAVIVGGGLFFSQVQKRKNDMALYNAADFRRTDQALSLIQAGANVNVRNEDGRTPLHAAASSGNNALIQALLSHGAHVNAADQYGETPLAYAAIRAQIATAKLLLKSGANPRLRSTFGRTPTQDAQGPLQLH